MQQILCDCSFRGAYGNREVEYEDMQECTFKPRLSEKEVEADSTKLKDVKGVDKYMQFIQLKKKNQIEQQQRENKVFHIERNYDITKKSKKTQIQPFKLSKVVIASQ